MHSSTDSYAMTTGRAFKKVHGVRSLYQRDGRFYARITVGGKQTYRSLNTSKKREAENALAQIKTGKPMAVISQKQPTLYEAMQECLEFRNTRRGASRPLSRRTISTHQELASKARELFPNRQLSRYKDSDFMKPLEESGLSASRRKQIFELIKGSFERAKNLGQIELNPLKGIVPAQVRRRERDLPSREQFDSVCHAMETLFSKKGRGQPVAGGRGAALSTRFLAFSGMRINEALGVEWDHIADGKIEVYGKDGELKTANSRRSIHINRPLQEVLDEIGKIYGRNGRVMPTANLRKYLEEACAHVGIQRMTHHDLRSWFATWCVLAGVDVDTCARWMGDEVTTILRVYLQVNDES
ncbi:MAG: hypothetical protein CMO40_06325, partial [Verrucomicrobiaceae bacterium]|nr:hypothetical protein [Verrucomicrobiaceae bacterium]